jgi:hypothetical protein
MKSQVLKSMKSSAIKYYEVTSVIKNLWSHDWYKNLWSHEWYKILWSHDSHKILWSHDWYLKKTMMSRLVWVSEWVSDCCANSAIVAAILWLIFNETMTRSTLYYTNTLSWIFIVLAHWNNSPRDRHVAPLGHIILMPSQPVFVLLNAAYLL